GIRRDFERSVLRRKVSGPTYVIGVQRHEGGELLAGPPFLVLLDGHYAANMRRDTAERRGGTASDLHPCLAERMHQRVRAHGAHNGEIGKLAAEFRQQASRPEDAIA